MKKINLYVFIQIIKSCTLIFFIFISIAWLLQISRLFSHMDSLKIGFNSIILLSLYLIPNLINITLPFILIFGLTLAFLKLDKDKEIIAIFSLGLSIDQISKPLIFISIIVIIIYLFLNLFISPYVYDKYKIKEFEIRNQINLEKLNISNFIKLDDNTILDFQNNNQNFENIFLNYKNIDENIIFAKKGLITNDHENMVFNLFDGFKISINNEEIEKLEFQNYKINIPNKNKNIYKNYDKNTLTIFDLIKQKKIIAIYEKFFDTILLVSSVVFFFFYIIKENIYKLKRILIFLLVIILILIIQNVLKTIETKLNTFIILNILNISIIYAFLLTKNIGRK